MLMNLRLKQNYRTWSVASIPICIMRQLAKDLEPKAANGDIIGDLNVLLKVSAAENKDNERRWSSREYLKRHFPGEAVNQEVAHLLFLLRRMQRMSRCCYRWWCPDYKRHWPSETNFLHNCFTVDGLMTFLSSCDAQRAVEIIRNNAKDIQRHHRFRHSSRFVKHMLEVVAGLLCSPSNTSQDLNILIDWNSLMTEEVEKLVRTARMNDYDNVFVVPECPDRHDLEMHDWKDFAYRQISALGRGSVFLVGETVAAAQLGVPHQAHLRFLLDCARTEGVVLLAIASHDDDPDVREGDEEDDPAEGVNEQELFPYGAFSLENGLNELILAFQSCAFLRDLR